MTEIIEFPHGTVENHSKPALPSLIEPAMAPEFFVADLGRLDVYGSFVRLIFCTLERPVEDSAGRPQRTVNLKVVIPTECLREMRAAIDAAIEEAGS